MTVMIYKKFFHAETTFVRKYQKFRDGVGRCPSEPLRLLQNAPTLFLLSCVVRAVALFVVHAEHDSGNAEWRDDENKHRRERVVEYPIQNTYRVREKRQGAVIL